MHGRSIKINRIPAAIAVILVFCFMFYMFNGTEEVNQPQYGLLVNQYRVSMRKLLIGAVQAAERGGLEILDVARTRDLQEKSKGKTDEGANDPYTAADSRSHCVMKQGLHRIFPLVKIISEEDSENCLHTNTFDLDPTVLHETEQLPYNVMVDVNDVTVWIDPLDATQEFTEQLYKYVTTMVCVAVSGIPVVGVIHSPFIGETVWAWVDQSMSENLKEILPEDTNNNKQPIDKPIIIVSRSHPGGVNELTRSVFGEKSNIITAGGAGYKVLQVVAKNATAYLHSTKIKKWDICAGDAILRALHGKMTTLNDELIDYSQNGTPVNSHGLLATLDNHEHYIGKLMEYENNHKTSAKQR